MAEGIAEGEIFVIGNKFLFSIPSISRSAEDLSLDMEEEEEEEEKIEGSSPRESFEDDTVCEIASSNASTSYSEAGINPKHDSQWRGFFRKLKPAMGLHSFHRTIPSVKKLSKKKSRNLTKSMPGLPSHLDAEFYCLESSWLNFSLSDLENATNHFSHENLIGEGGYSEVYKGVLEDGKLVAIKRLTRGSPEEMTSDFLSELGILVHVNHPNIANVIGYGVEEGMHLVLPLSPHGSLASLLTGEKEKLDWDIRYNIALGIASGLSYLHEGCQRRIIHRDIKTANILLTEDFEPQVTFKSKDEKISDFGLAKWLPDQWPHLTVSQFEGTFGYLPPEFFLHGLVDEKTDVYSYGVLVLELITGRPAIDKSQKSLVMWAKPLVTKKNIVELVDPLLASDYDAEQMTLVVSVVSMCIHESSTERPKMSKVVRILKGDEVIMGSRKMFQKRPSFKRKCSLNLSDDEDLNSTTFLNDLNQQNQIALEL